MKFIRVSNVLETWGQLFDRHHTQCRIAVIKGHFGNPRLLIDNTDPKFLFLMDIGGLRRDKVNRNAQCDLDIIGSIDLNPELSM